MLFDDRSLIIMKILWFAENLGDDQKKWFLDFYRKLCRTGLAELARREKDPDPPPKPVRYTTPPWS